jgi:hypothetical protein
MTTEALVAEIPEEMKGAPMPGDTAAAWGICTEVGAGYELRTSKN